MISHTLFVGVEIDQLIGLHIVLKLLEIKTLRGRDRVDVYRSDTTLVFRKQQLHTICNDVVKVLPVLCAINQRSWARVLKIVDSSDVRQFAFVDVVWIFELVRQGAHSCVDVCTDLVALMDFRNPFPSDADVASFLVKCVGVSNNFLPLLPLHILIIKCTDLAKSFPCYVKNPNVVRVFPPWVRVERFVR